MDNARSGERRVRGPGLQIRAVGRVPSRGVPFPPPGISVTPSFANLLRGKLGIVCAAILLGFGVTAQEPPDPTPATSTNLPLKQIGPGIFELGKVRFDKKQRTLRFPAVINQTQGPIEYLIVTSYGKTHESLLRTDAEPYHIQLALLLLGAQGAGTNSFPEDGAVPLPGDVVVIELEWKMKGTEKRARAEDFVHNLQTKSIMSKGPWVYNGSLVLNGTFIAQQDGSIVSVMVDPYALINNPRPGRENDKIWQVRPKGLPPLNSAVEVMIRLESPKQSGKP